jgi:hypothetical protein
MAAEEIGGYMLVGGYGLMLFGVRRVLALLLALLVVRFAIAPDAGRHYFGSALVSG